jgi:hypothetical protein
LDKIAEIIEATSTEFTAQCYELYHLPSLGALVKAVVGEFEIYGIVYRAATTSIEPGRRPIARGKDEPSEEAVYRENPQLAKLLRSEFSTSVVGFKDGITLHYFLPPTPPRIHGFVYLCSPDEVSAFSGTLDFLGTIVNTSLPIPTEEVTAAALRQMSQTHPDPRRFLVEAGKVLTVLLGDDYYRLRMILGKLRTDAKSVKKYD